MTKESFFHLSSKEELRFYTPQVKTSKVCVFCSCDENNFLFRDEVKRFGPLTKNATSPTSNGIFRPYLAGEGGARENGSRTPSPDMKENLGMPKVYSLPINVGYFFKPNLSSVVDSEDFIWAHSVCMEWSRCTSVQASTDIFRVVSTGLSQVNEEKHFFYMICWTFVLMKLICCIFVTALSIFMYVYFPQLQSV